MIIFDVNVRSRSIITWFDKLERHNNIVKVMRAMPTTAIAFSPKSMIN